MDYSDKAYWSHAQAIAWLRFRDEKEVNRAGRPAVGERAMYSAAVAAIIEPEGKPKFMPSGEAVRQLEVAAASGSLRTIGLRNGQGDFQAIPEAAWASGRLTFAPDVLAPREQHRGASTWHSPLYSRNDLLRLWPDPAGILDLGPEPSVHVVDRPAETPPFAHAPYSEQMVEAQGAISPTAGTARKGKRGPPIKYKTEPGVRGALEVLAQKETAQGVVDQIFGRKIGKIEECKADASQP